MTRKEYLESLAKSCEIRNDEGGISYNFAFVSPSDLEDLIDYVGERERELNNSLNMSEDTASMSVSDNVFDASNASKITEERDNIIKEIYEKLDAQSKMIEDFKTAVTEKIEEIKGLVEMMYSPSLSVSSTFETPSRDLREDMDILNSVRSLDEPTPNLQYASDKVKADINIADVMATAYSPSSAEVSSFTELNDSLRSMGATVLTLEDNDVGFTTTSVLLENGNGFSYSIGLKTYSDENTAELQSSQTQEIEGYKSPQEILEYAKELSMGIDNLGMGGMDGL